MSLKIRNLSIATITTYLRHIKSFIHWSCDNGFITDKELYKSIKLPKQPKKIVRIYTDFEIKAIYERCTTTIPWITARNKLIISLMLDSGLRRHELTLIKKDDINQSILMVHGKGNKDRLVPLGNITKEHLQDYLDKCPYKSSQLLLTRNGSIITDNAIKLFVSKISEQLPFAFSCHKLRHNFATNFLLDSYEKNGFYDAYTLQILLGHEDLRTTDRYVHLAAQFIATNKRVSHLDKLYNNGV